MNIFNSLGSNYDLKFALKALFAQNKESYGKNLKEFLEKMYGGRAILVYKGREAIEILLEILKLPKDSFVAINGFTCFAVYKAVTNQRYEAEILDLPNSLDLNFSAETLENSLKQNPKIKAVIVQNTLGYPCDIEKIAKICRNKNIILVEDLAHSVGTIYENGKEAGTIGDFVVLSFSQDKIIDAVSGGALIIRSKKYQNYVSRHPRLDRGSDSRFRGNDKVDTLSILGSKQQLLDRFYPLFTFIIRKTYRIGIGRPIHFLFKALNLLSIPMNEGFYTKYNLPGWYAYLAMDAFANLNKNLEHRRKIANIYNSMLDKKIAYLSTLRYPIFVENRNSLIKHLKNRGVYVSDIWYDSVDNNLKNTKAAADKILNLPTHKCVSEEDAKNIAQEINLWLKSQ